MQLHAIQDRNLVQALPEEAWLSAESRPSEASWKVIETAEPGGSSRRPPVVNDYNASRMQTPVESPGALWPGACVEIAFSREMQRSTLQSYHLILT